MSPSRRLGFLKLLGPFLGLASLAVYLFTLSRGAYPGDSVEFIVQSAGLTYSPRPDYPLWRGLAWLLSRLPVGSIATRLNLVSALFGGLAVWLIYEVVQGAIRAVIQPDSLSRSETHVAARAGGITSAGLLAFCVPFWSVSTRAHPYPLGVFLLLLDTWLFLRLIRTRRNLYLYLFALVFALGTVESAALTAVGPLLWIGVAVFLWFRRRLDWRSAVPLLVCLLLAGLLYLLAAWIFQGSEGYEVRGYRSLVHVVIEMLRRQYMAIRHGLPQVGWIIVLATTVAPWLAMLMVAYRTLNREQEWSLQLLHVAMTALVVCVALEVSFAPHAVAGGAKLLVMPYVLTAVVGGYVVCFWYVTLAWLRDPDRRRYPAGPIVRWGGAAVVVVGFALIVVCACRNFRQADGRPAGVVDAYARAVVEAVEGRPWLVTGGWFDDHLRLAAADMKTELRLINCASGGAAYAKHVAEGFEGIELKSLATVGLLPMVREWFRSDPEIQSEVAVMSLPDLWSEAGLVALPNKTVFMGVPAEDTIDTARVIADHKEFWSDVAAPVSATSAVEPQLEKAIRLASQQSGFVANNLGVLLEDLGQPDAAYDVYRQTEDLDPNNIAAMINRLIMLERGHPAPDAEAARTELEEKIEGMRRRYTIWSLAQQFGHVRLPRAFAELAAAWSEAGSAAMAASAMDRAVGLLPEDRLREALISVGSFHLARGERERGEAIYADILKADAGNTAAMLGMFRAALQEMDLSQARAWLEKLRQAGATPSQVPEAWSSYHLAAGELDQARKLAQDAVDLSPDSLRPRLLLAHVLAAQEDREALDTVIRSLETMEGAGQYVSELRGTVARKEGDMAAARAHLRDALAMRPNDERLRERSARLAVSKGDHVAALRDARRLLRQDPQHPFGNYLLGRSHYRDGDVDLAETFLRRSLEKKRLLVALVDLAWLLQVNGEYEEAEQLAREAVGKSDKLKQAWDTLGVVLMRTNRLAEAEEAFQKAFSPEPRCMNVLIHMAELELLKGDPARAEELYQQIRSRQAELPEDYMQELHRLAGLLPTG